MVLWRLFAIRILLLLELMQYIKGPDFPTAGYILGREGIKQAYIDRPRHDYDAGEDDD